MKDKKRIVFLFSHILCLSIPVLLILIKRPDLVFASLMIFVLIHMLSFAFLVFFGKSGLTFPNEIITPFFAFFTYKNFKRCYYTKFGYFYIKVSDTSVAIWKQVYFQCVQIDKIYSNKEINFEEIIKNRLDHFLSNKDAITEASEPIKKIKKWDGYVGVVSRREDKLKGLL